MGYRYILVDFDEIVNNYFKTSQESDSTQLALMDLITARCISATSSLGRH